MNNSEKIEFWVPFYVVWVPFLLKIGSPLGPLFRIFGSPLDCGTVLLAPLKSILQVLSGCVNVSSSASFLGPSYVSL